MYGFIRDDLQVPFYNGKESLDASLQTIFDAIRGEKMTNVVLSMMKDVLKTQDQ